MACFLKKSLDCLGRIDVIASSLDPAVADVVNEIRGHEEVLPAGPFIARQFFAIDPAESVDRTMQHRRCLFDVEDSGEKNRQLRVRTGSRDCGWTNYVRYRLGISWSRRLHFTHSLLVARCSAERTD